MWALHLAAAGVSLAASTRRCLTPPGRAASSTSTHPPHRMRVLPWMCMGTLVGWFARTCISAGAPDDQQQESDRYEEHHSAAAAELRGRRVCIRDFEKKPGTSASTADTT
jgi:hypothetical protein